jgi:hypothetical protein
MDLLDLSDMDCDEWTGRHGREYQALYTWMNEAISTSSTRLRIWNYERGSAADDY